MINIKNKHVYKHWWLRPFMWLFYLTPLVSFLTLKMTGMGPDLFAFICLWGISAGSAILMKSGYNAVQVAFKNHEIDEKDHQHWSARTLFGAWLGTIISIPMAVFFCFMMIDTKVNLSITAVPTPELMAEMKYFLNEPNVEHSPVEFNGQEQEVVFYTNAHKYSGIPSLIKGTKGRFPEYSFNDNLLNIDYLNQYKTEIFTINGKRTCFYTRKILSPLETVPNFTPVLSNLPFEDFGIYIIHNKLAIDVSSKFETRERQDGCWSYRVNSSGAKKTFRKNMTAYFKQPYLAFTIKKAVDSTRLTFSTWKKLNEKFQRLAS